MGAVMKIAIIGRGQSALNTYPRAASTGFHIIIAINCAINQWKADWLVGDDPSTHGFVTGRPLVGAAYRSDLAQPGETLPPHLPQWAGWSGKWIDRAGKMAYPHTFSVESAICLAAELGGTEAHFFGCLPLSDGDPKPEPGTISSPGRQICDDLERWRLEQKCMQRALTTYNIKGISHG